MSEKDITIFNSLENIFKGVITGILCAYIIIYALRPSVPYPDFIIEIFENYFIFIILFIIDFYLFSWNNLIGILFLIFIISLIFDYYIFINNGMKKIINNNINYNNNENIIENFTIDNDKFINIILKYLEYFGLDFWNI